MLCVEIFLVLERQVGKKMSMQDPISDLLTQIRNGYLARKNYIIVFSSKFRIAIVDLLKKEYFLDDYILIDKDTTKSKIKIVLKYYGDKIPVIRKIVRISKSSTRVYCKKDALPKVLNGFGIAVISTSVGLLTDNEARKLGHGGEILCTVE